MARVATGLDPTDSQRHPSRRFARAAGALLTALLASGCTLGGDEKLDSPVNLAERIGCSGSYEAVTTDALGVKEQGRCTFRGYEISLVTFDDNGQRNSYVCSTCALTVDTGTEEVETAGLRSGGYFLVGDRYLVQSPNVVVERAVRAALK